MIGLQLAGKNNRITASSFVRSLNSFLDLLRDVDSTVSKQSRGTVRWELTSLQQNSPAVVEVTGVSRITQMDYSQAIQESVIDGIEQLGHRAEQPQFYSHAALRRVRSIAELSKKFKFVSVFSGDRRTVVSDRVLVNVDYLIASGSKSFGSIKGSLDAILVHSGHEFRVWSSNYRRPVVCHFERKLLPSVTEHLQQEIEVIGELSRNSKGEPVMMEVETFRPLEPLITSPAISEMRGLVQDFYGGLSLKNYLDELRNG